MDQDGLTAGLGTTVFRGEVSQNAGVISGAVSGRANTIVGSQTYNYYTHGTLQEESQADSQARHKFLAWLNGIDFRNDHEIILKKRYQQTSAWIIEREEFDEWASEPGSRLLWCWGPPGIGKSVIASIVLEYLKSSTEEDEKTAVVYAYFKHDDQERQTPEAIIASFIKQLCRKSKIPEFLLDFWRDYVSNIEEPTLNDYIKQFSEFLKSFTKVFLLVDALDECKQSHRIEIFNFFNRILEAHDYIKIFVTSRQEEDIKDAFEELQTPVIPIGAREVGKDIDEFVQGRVQEWLRKKRTIISRELEAKVVSALVSKAEGMFLWVDLQLQMLQKCRRGIDVEDELGKLPQGLNKTYQRILDQIGQLDDRLQTLAQRALAWVFYAERPLSITELIEATAIEEDCLTRQDLDSRKYQENDIFQACANLLTQELSVVRPIHYSVVEYFTKTPGQNNSRVFRSLTNSNLAYACIANCCIWYLLLDSLATWPCDDDNELDERAAQNPLALHAAYRFDYYILKVDDVPLDLSKNLDRLLLSQVTSLASLLQLRNLRDNSDWDYIQGNFTILEDVTPEHIIYSTSLYNSKQLLSTNGRWNDIQPPKDALHLAARAGSPEAIKRAIQNGNLVRQKDTHGLTALYYASEGGYIPICKALVEQGADVNAQGGHFGNALQAASYGGHQAVVDVLLARGADVNAQGGHFGNALQAASLGGHQGIVDVLLTKGADVNAQGGDFGNALQAASYRGYQALVDVLLTKGADINAQGGHYGNALQAASYGGHQAVVDVLLARGADVNAQGGHFGIALQAASSGGHQALVDVLLTKGADINAQGGHFGNALQAASYRGYQALVDVLLTKGADINAQGGHYGNALQAASYGGHQAVVDVLLTKGADINAQGGRFGNALQAASFGGYQALVDVLLTKGADINAQGGHFGNALYAASLEGHQALVEVLLARGADVNAQGGHFGNALQAASFGGHQAVVDVLLTKGADINAQGGHFGNALYAASLEGHQGVVDVLLTKGADINAQGGRFGNALQAASSGGYQALVDVLLTKGADVNAQGGHFGNALQAASYRGHQALVDVLLAQGADVNAQGGDFGNALQAASFGGHQAVVDVLLTKGADVNAQGGHFGNALYAASLGGHQAVVDVLLAQGGY